MHNLDSLLFILRPGDPEVLERGQGCQNGAPNPCRVFPLRGREHFDLLGGGQVDELLQRPVLHALEHRRPPGQHDIPIQQCRDVGVAFLDGVDGSGRKSLLDPIACCGAVDLGAEQGLTTRVPLWAYIDLRPVREHMAERALGLLLRGGVVLRHGAELLLQERADFRLVGGVEADAGIGQDALEVLCQVRAPKVELQDGVEQGEALEDGDGVACALARLDDNAGGASTGVHGQHRSHGHIEGRDLELLEEDLAHLLTVLLRVQGRLGQQDGSVWVVGLDLQAIEVQVLPDPFHGVPVLDEAVLDGVREVQLLLPLGRLGAHKGVCRLDVLLAFWKPCTRGYDDSGAIIPTKAGLDCAAP
mmetsp:Transcript_71860/g.126601  ORF Transcript_71860/g.126601 Transcript_71860/m.126601 type:complete len:359 (+) Transcript_71860:290-1366(+)